MSQRPRLAATPKLFGSSYLPPPTPTAHSTRIKPLFLIVLIIVMFYVIRDLPFFRLQSIEITGTTDQRIIDAANELKGQSIFSGKVGSFAGSLQRSHAEIDRALCRRGLPNTFKCNLSYRKTALTWKQGSSYFSVDSAGYVFGPLQVPEGLVVDDQLSQKIDLGTNVISSELIKQYLRLKQLCDDKNIPVSSLFVRESLFQVGAIFALPDKPNLTAYFTVVSPLDTQVSELRATLDAKATLITERVDLRVPGRVYFK